MSEKTVYSQADLKKLHKDDLVGIANKEFGLDFVVDETSIPALVGMILKAQNTGASTGEDKAPEQAPASSQDQADPEKEKAPETSEEEAPPAQTPEFEHSADTIFVRSTQRHPDNTGGWKQAFRERHPDHPGGQAWIANGKVHRVANTAAIKRAVLDGILEQVDRAGE